MNFDIHSQLPQLAHNLAAARLCLLRALCCCCRLDVLDENLRSSPCAAVLALIALWAGGQRRPKL